MSEVLREIHEKDRDIRLSHLRISKQIPALDPDYDAIRRLVDGAQIFTSDTSQLKNGIIIEIAAALAWAKNFVFSSDVGSRDLASGKLYQGILMSYMKSIHEKIKISNLTHLGSQSIFQHRILTMTPYKG